MALSTDALQATKRAIEGAEHILVIPHANVDPDGLSSALACHAMFRALGKECTVICPETPPEALKFLPGYESLSQEVLESQNFIITLDTSGGIEIDKLRYSVEDQKVNIIVVPKKGTLKKEFVHVLEGEPNYDLIVVVDTAEPALLGSLYTDHIDLFSSVPVVNIDHHVSNTQFGQVHLIDPSAASATQVLYALFTSDEKWNRNMTADMATLLLTGLITDTRSFQNPNTTPRSLEVAAELLDLGARQQEIVQHIYKTKPLSTLKIWGRALNRIQIDPQSRIVWSAVSNEDMREMGATSKETSGILDELISTIPDADIYVLFTELEGGGLKASLRSSPAVDASRLAGRTFGGGGHPRAAGFSVKKFDNFQLQVMECIRTLKEEMHRQQTADDAPLPPSAHRNSSPAIIAPIEPVTPHSEISKEQKGIDVVEMLNKENGDIIASPSENAQQKPRKTNGNGKKNGSV